MFYDFWFSFKSWRVFPHEDEEDVEQAEFREQRRWIERYVGAKNINILRTGKSRISFFSGLRVLLLVSTWLVLFAVVIIGH